MAILQQLFGTPPLPAHKVADGDTVIGRHEDCDIVVESPAVSRRHARIWFEDGHFVIEDLDSRNGTAVNGRRISEPTNLNDEDHVEISTLPFTFRCHTPHTEQSGSWGVKPKVISLSRTIGEDVDSVRRQAISRGDKITREELGVDPIRAEQLVSSLQAWDGDGVWPVANNSTRKLNHALRLLHALRPEGSGTEQILDAAIQTMFEVFPSADCVSVVLRDPAASSVRVAAVSCRNLSEEVEICLPLVRYAFDHTEAILYVDHWKDDDSDDAVLGDGTVRSILVGALCDSRGEPVGAVQLDTANHNQPLDTEDLELLVILNQILSFALVRAPEKDGRAALIPASTPTGPAASTATGPGIERHGAGVQPHIAGYRVTDAIHSVAGGGADRIDYVSLSEERMACLVVDLPGHGPQAVAQSSEVAQLLREGMLESGSAAETVRHLEKSLAAGFPERPLTSVAVMVLDSERSSVTVSVAGHCPLLMIHQNELKEIDSRQIIGPALGIARESYVEAELQLSDNDMILVFTDGIVRLTNPEGQVLSRHQLKEMIREAAAGRRRTFEHSLRTLLHDYRQGAPLPDDIGFAVIQRTTDIVSADYPPEWHMDSETQQA
ncbi:MAG: SpoIIE family protein phosphatase [Fuerstiella sp.]